MNRKEDFDAQSDKYVDSRKSYGVNDPYALKEIGEAYYQGAEYGYQYAIEKACDWLKMMDVNDYLKIVPGFGYVIEDEDAIKGFRRAMEV
jgi:hypothetical protein